MAASGSGRKKAKFSCLLCECNITSLSDADSKVSGAAVCSDCSDFCKASDSDVAELKKMRQNMPKLFAIVLRSCKDYRTNKEEPSHIDFPQEELWEEAVTRPGSLSSFKTRESFKAKDKCYPDEAKLFQIHGSGDDVHGRMMNDEAATIAVLLQKRLNGMQEITEEPAACLTTLVHEVYKHVEEVTQATLALMEATLANMIASAEPWARGGEDGSSWFCEAKDNSDIAAVLAIGTKTLCARTVYQSTRYQMDTVLKKLVETSARFATTVGEDLKAKATATMNDLALSHIESLLIALYTGNFQKKFTKTKTYGIKMLVKAPLKWAMVHEALRACAHTAIKFL
jgi:hypothetical protein